MATSMYMLCYLVFHYIVTRVVKLSVSGSLSFKMHGRSKLSGSLALAVYTTNFAKTVWEAYRDMVFLNGHAADSQLMASYT